MDIINLAREIGKQIQQDERYLKLKIVQQNNEQDEALQGMIGEFNLKRVAINNEATKKDKDENKIQTLNDELRKLYEEIMQSKSMIDYNSAKQGMDNLLKRITAIIVQSAEGEDPQTTDYEESCGGNCSSCGGCH